LNVSAGRIDSAAGLAALLIPDVRPDRADIAGCGPGRHFDSPRTDRAFFVKAVFVGSALDVLDDQTLLQRVPARFIRSEMQDFHDACSAEVRGRFTSALAHAVSRREVDAEYLRLSVSGERQIRLYRFTEPRRAMPPVLREPVGNVAARGGAVKRRIAHVLAAFWKETAPRLRNPKALCPNAYGALLPARADAITIVLRRSERKADPAS
jgi:hypothetical protein